MSNQVAIVAGLVFRIDRIPDMLRTAVNVTGSMTTGRWWLSGIAGAEGAAQGSASREA
jgi:L-cystine uptake protein TcyP (sodium:dicarboxylate symporter family)